MDERTSALANRSLRTIRTELEFLTDVSIISPQQLSSLLSQLPPQTSLHAPLSNITPALTPTPLSQAPFQPAQPSQPSFTEKQSSFYAPTPSPGSPAYNPPAPTSIATATALYAYAPSDAGDLALSPNDRIAILEYMNADWAKGRNERTGQEGIFPRSYVNVVEDKNGLPTPATQPAGTNYGNMPLAVSQGSGEMTGTNNSKVNEQGKKFGKKLGNAGPPLQKGNNVHLHERSSKMPQSSSTLDIDRELNLAVATSSDLYAKARSACFGAAEKAPQAVKMAFFTLKQRQLQARKDLTDAAKEFDTLAALDTNLAAEIFRDAKDEFVNANKEALKAFDNAYEEFLVAQKEALRELNAVVNTMIADQENILDREVGRITQTGEMSTKEPSYSPTTSTASAETSVFIPKAAQGEAVPKAKMKASSSSLDLFHNKE
ncbi:MAG: hypothetical protein Q9187_004586 [Circinaria calcarea]